GLGSGICVLLLASIIGALAVRKNNPASNDSAWRKFVRWSPLISLLAVFTQANLTALARVLIPYYPLLIPVLLAGAGQERLMKKKWWRFLAFIIFIIAGGLLVISPARPLFPALTVLKKISAYHPNSKTMSRMEEVYSVYRQRNDAFAPARNILPSNLHIVGLTAFDEPETSLWRPFGSRQIVHICPQDTPNYLKSRGVEYILVKDEMFGEWFPESFNDWLKKMNAQIVQKISLNLRAATGPTDWYLVKLN
ncbi:MAG TPA: hypothetical protein VFC85_01155, partial [Verrucomicrobiae bacterium]|nr:hypothetical protein [Verrucomicrobiae bacterium]